MPRTISVSLADVRDRSGRLRDLGAARPVQCADAEAAQVLIHDRELGRL